MAAIPLSNTGRESAAMSEMQVDETAGGTVLTYGSVELRLCPLYHPGDLLRVSSLLRVEIVTRVEHADGVVIFAKLPREGGLRPSVYGVLFTHYIRHRAVIDDVDHNSTLHVLQHPSERLRFLTEQAFHVDLVQRSVAASLTYTPKVAYL
jgi:hypothetical protein